MQALKFESDLRTLLCADCDAEFKRPAEYLAQKRTDPLFKWTCAKCDSCKEKRVNQAFNRLSEITDVLSA